MLLKEVRKCLENVEKKMSVIKHNYLKFVRHKVTRLVAS